MDYGSLPQWLALVVGAVVAGYTVLGIRTARNAYRDDVQTRTFANARLVTAYVSRTQSVMPKEIRYVRLEPGWILLQPDREVSLHLRGTVFGNHGILYRNRNKLQSYRLYVVSLQNLSQEMISDIVLSFGDLGGEADTFSGALTAVIDGIAPEQTRHVYVCSIENFATEDLYLLFADSIGVQWERRGSSPVQRIERTK